MTTLENTDLASSPAEILARLRALRPEMSENGVRSDTDGTDVAQNMRLLGEVGVNRLNVPVEFGGLWQGGMWGGLRDVSEALVEISAADGSTGQCSGANFLVARQLFVTDLPDATKQQLAGEMIQEGRRLVSSVSESGGTGRVTGRVAPGGIVVSGTKTFNTNSGGGGRDLLVVRLALLGPDEDLATATPHFALVRLDDPKLRLAHDWDNMGQRGTDSQTITYDDVFVPDGWHCAPPAVDPYFVGAVMLANGTLLQGIGEGAFDAAIEYLRTVNRATMPRYASAQEDPLMHRQLGEMSGELAAARALLLSVAAEIEATAGTPEEASARGVQANVMSTRASLDVSTRIFDLTGARSTANRYRLDRFWRNARTFATHEAIDMKNAFVGDYEITGKFPNIPEYIRL
ncbi:acyl-CoA dehydrogenase family protein [Amycolatopsis sp. GM8]|uniref:acyl-CoA dehydrogenase family protein n=1 Tax=Amycolatopsis sp. GM8 TaxID=2896530 RepID=UPI001F490ACE|nr:acyl-CoA dehydrogenase family protein [Amycolatopsis sp. GM8]